MFYKPLPPDSAGHNGLMHSTLRAGTSVEGGLSNAGRSDGLDNTSNNPIGLGGTRELGKTGESRDGFGLSPHSS